MSERLPYYHLTDQQMADAKRHALTMILPAEQVKALRRRAIGTSMAAHVCRWRLVEAFQFLAWEAFGVSRWRGDEILSVAFLILASAVHGRPKAPGVREIVPLGPTHTVRGFERCLIRRLRYSRRRWEREEQTELKAMSGRFRQTRKRPAADYATDPRRINPVEASPPGSARMEAEENRIEERRWVRLNTAALLTELPELRLVLREGDDIEFVDALLSIARGGTVAEGKLKHWAESAILARLRRLRRLGDRS